MKVVLRRDDAQGIQACRIRHSDDMGDVVGDLLPLAVGVAVSPVPIIATILMLLAPQARGTSLGFLLGWVIGIVVATTVFVVVASTAGLDDGSSDSSATSSWIKVVLGVLLLLVAVRQWRKRPEAGEVAALPKWMSAIDSLTFVKALALGFLLSAINPKNLLMCVAAGSAIGGAVLSTGEMVGSVAIFTVIAASTVALPVAGFLVAHERLRGPLDELRTWLQANNTAVMSVLLLVIGVVLLGQGIGGL
jgi:threonine/homoserine/homoserine lactone efflux protein